MSRKKREKSMLELIIETLKTADLRLRLADDLDNTEKQKRIALHELENASNALTVQIRNLRDEL
jgi:GTPase Era involved in 16S rRNA processing